MEICFTNVSGLGSANVRSLSFGDSEHIRGDVEINFIFEGKVEPFRQTNVNVPLVIAEAKQFFDQITKSGRATWRLGFAPFVDGRTECNKIILYTGVRNDPEGGIVEVLTRDQLKDIQNHLAKLQWRYGLLVPSSLQR